MAYKEDTRLEDEKLCSSNLNVKMSQITIKDKLAAPTKSIWTIPELLKQSRDRGLIKRR